MKKLITNGLMVLAVGLFAPQLVQAQETTYLSNLGQSFTNSNPVASDSWLAAGFLTGTNTSGYTLNSIQLGMTDATGNPSGFTAMIYGAGGIGGLFPQSSLGTLSGSANPSTAGTYTYTDGSNITLSPHTDYFIVLTAGTTAANGAYEWNFTSASSYNPSDNWGASVTLSSSNGSSSWIRLGANPQYDFSEFAINATAVPEPSVAGLLSLGGLGFLWHRRKAKAV
jgi:hypothetical protein